MPSIPGGMRMSTNAHANGRSMPRACATARTASSPWDMNARSYSAAHGDGGAAGSPPSWRSRSSSDAVTAARDRRSRICWKSWWIASLSSTTMMRAGSLDMGARSRGWNSQDERGALAETRARAPERAAQLLGGERRRVQAVAVALGLGREAGAEDPQQRLGGDAAAGVLDGELDPAGVELRGDGDPARAGCARPGVRGDRVARVGEQVDQDLEDPVAIERDRAVVLDPAHELEAVAIGIGAAQADRLLDQRAEFDLLPDAPAARVAVLHRDHAVDVRDVIAQRGQPAEHLGAIALERRCDRGEVADPGVELGRIDRAGRLRGAEQLPGAPHALDRKLAGALVEHVDADVDRSQDVADVVQHAGRD